MIRNFILITFRNFSRNKFFTALNLIGLSLGLSCSILILLWINDELKFDAFHENGPRLYRVLKRDFFQGGQEVYPQGPGILVDALKAEIPEIETGSQMSWAMQELVTVGKESHRQAGRYVQPDFLKMFSFPVITGNVALALDKPTDIVISEKLADQYFPNEDPIGKLVRINNRKEFQVSAVIKNVPRNSSIQFDYLLHWDMFLQQNEWAKEWENNGSRAFVMLRDASQQNEVDNKIKDFVRKRVSNPETNISELFLQPYEEWYLYSKFTRGQQDGGRIDYVKSFSLAALVVLVIACINFMNLATAQSLKRAKEVGIRKVTGAAKRVLVTQFFGEAIIYAYIGLGIALLIVEIALPTFRMLTDKQIDMPYNNPTFMVGLAGIALGTGLLSGLYPAFFLSSFDIVKVLKGTLKFGTGPTFLRKGLVVFQFSLTILLIFCTMVIYQQMQFIRDKNLGFDKENLLTVNFEEGQWDKIKLVAEESANLTGIKSVTVSTTSPLVGGNSTTAVNWPGKSPDEQIAITQMAVGYDYLSTMGIELLEGRDFSRDFKTDSAAYIVNEEMVRIMNLEKPLGQTVTFWEVPGPIIGVVKNYHINSLHVGIEPVILHLHPQWSNLIIARTEAGKTKETLEDLRQITQKINPGFPFTYNFVDDMFAEQYKGENVISALANYFSVIAIFISCLGLLGLISYSAEQRTKEIGVRKVLGASVKSIYVLFSRDFLYLVVIAFVIAAPLGWYIMNSWLHDFAYRTKVNTSVFIVSGIAAMSIALLTISYQALKAAVANPIKSLRNE
jgi:ABC-type antimicrobial peptide transport system permease subunit